MAGYLFVDGEYLRTQFERTMKDVWNETPSIDYGQIFGQFGRLQRGYYYDAINYDKKDNETEAEREHRISQKKAIHGAVNAIDLWHVREGFVRGGGRRNREGRAQKGVDVQ